MAKIIQHQQVTPLSAGRNIWNTQALLVDMQKRTATLENGLEVSYKAKHILTTLIDGTTSHTYTQMFKVIAVLFIIAKS